MLDWLIGVAQFKCEGNAHCHQGSKVAVLAVLGGLTALVCLAVSAWLSAWHLNSVLFVVTTLSSKGWRRVSRAWPLYSGSSSRKSTPLWARVISPGWGMRPPPTRPACEIVWCGARKGRTRMRGWRL